MKGDREGGPWDVSSSHTDVVVVCILVMDGGNRGELIGR